MRSKEAANDYRYFPEPDLQPITVDEKQISAIRSKMPALPRELFLKYTKELGLSEYDAYNLTDNKGIALYYEAIIQHTTNFKSAANWMMGEVKSYLNEFGVDIEAFPLSPSKIASVIQLIDSGKISHSAASQKLFPALLKEPTADPAQLSEHLNLLQDSSADAIMTFIQQVIDENPNEVERYRNGEKQLTGFFMGQLMKISKGKADPKAANELMRKTLEG
jgi:aspartyl-tRNA(Asn)/glutamyl-tRNA(Gln) amidotransferase subunit B